MEEWFLLIILFFTGWWIYNDAGKRKYEHKWGAFFLGLFLGPIIGIAIWCHIRPELKHEKTKKFKKKERRKNIYALTIGLAIIVIVTIALCLWISL